MANKKITELTAVTTLPDAALLTAVDTTRGEGDQNVKITKANLQTDLGSTQDLEDVIAQDPLATSVPTFEGGVSLGNGTIASISLLDGNPDSFIISQTTALGLIHNTQVILNTPNTELTGDLTIGAYTLPNTDGTSGQVLKTDGSGALTWQDESGGSTSEIALYSATTTGTVTLDCATFDSWYRILTGNTDFQFSNTPASGETFVKTLEIITTAGETLTFSTADKVTGTLTSDNTTVNLININLANYPTLGLRITVNITQ